MKPRLLLLLLLAVTLLAYQPVWNGGFLWDDEGHVTREDLRPASGLAKIWFSPGATQQYYPVVHSTFWLFHRTWGNQPAGYHLANILLHGLSAWLLLVFLRRLSVPGAVLAAFIFALHPVHVESVAWISELKNVLSGVFYLAAALAYLRYDASGTRRSYLLALGLFVLAVLSKTVTVTFPVAMLVVLWWRRGRLRVREDFLPLLPFATIGLAAGLVTIWFERTLIGAQGEEFALTFVERSLVAARAVWFYAAKLAWPAHLVFVYPRWSISAAAASQWLYPLALSLVVLGAWLVRGWSRGPLAALAFFVITLFPALGFFNVYPFRFSYVADHFQYLASIGPIVLVSATAAVAARRFWPARACAVAACVIVLALASTTHAQSRQYANAESLYVTTIERNPAAWLARNNLAALLLEGEPPEDLVHAAIAHLEAAIRLKPDYAEAHYNLGTAFERLRRTDAAAAKYYDVLRIEPDQKRAHLRLAAIRHDRASQLLEQGLVHENAGRLDDAERAYREAATLDPRRAIIRRGRGRTLHRLGRSNEAIVEYGLSLELDPSSADTHNAVGVILAQSGRLREALQRFEAALGLDPEHEEARANLASARALIGRSP